MFFFFVVYFFCYFVWFYFAFYWIFSLLFSRYLTFYAIWFSLCSDVRAFLWFLFVFHIFFFLVFIRMRRLFQVHHKCCKMTTSALEKQIRKSRRFVDLLLLPRPIHWWQAAAWWRRSWLAPVRLLSTGSSRLSCNLLPPMSPAHTHTLCGYWQLSISGKEKRASPGSQLRRRGSDGCLFFPLHATFIISNGNKYMYVWRQMCMCVGKCVCVCTN